MKKLVSFLCTAVLLAVCVCSFAADPVTATAPAAVPQTSFVAWLQSNLAAILGIALAISELLGSSPWFKGNGILDSIIKSLKFLSGKQDGAAQ